MKVNNGKSMRILRGKILLEKIYGREILKDKEEKPLYKI